MDAALNVAMGKFKKGDAKRKTNEPVPQEQFDPANRAPIAINAITKKRWDKVPEVFKNDYFYPLLDTELTLVQK